MLKASHAIDGFLAGVANEHNKDLIERVRKHGTNLELQVNVSPLGGELVDGTVSTYTDGCNRWHSFRIPKGSYADPHWQDFTLRYPIEKHVDAIGSTGWLWASKLSLWVAFDIDSILGHAEGVGISDTELLKVREAVSALDYVEVRKSTSGKGLHLYVFLPDGITTNNHGEHAAVARAVLSQISHDVGFDMGTNIDVCGSNTWFWARRATVENEGFKLLKASKGVFPHSLANWRDHLPVVSRTRARVSIGIAEKDEDIFEQMASAHQRIPLDAKHIAIRDGLMGLKGTTIWVQDHHLLQTHTSLLKMLKETSSLDIVGVFETNSQGTNVNQPNCLAGDTKVVTREGGLTPIRELVGKSCEVMTSRSAWTTTTFKSYGSQAVYSITLRKGVSTKVVKATADHGWFVAACGGVEAHKKLCFSNRSRVETQNLTVGDKLIQVFSRKRGTLSLVGAQHGVVFGDGSCGGERINSDVALFAHKKNLLGIFQGHPYREYPENDSVVVTNLPRSFKQLPALDNDLPYLYGWLAGYFATDGCVSEAGLCILNSADAANIEHVRKICHLVGINCTPMSETTNSEGSYKPGSTQFKVCLDRAYLDEEFFLNPKHQARIVDAPRQRSNYWTVEGVAYAGVEEVFCCTVPETHCFVIEDHILTSNCFAFPLKDGAWRVTRFGAGTSEHASWSQDGKGWTQCIYNRRPSLEAAALVNGGQELSKGGYEFDMLRDAVRVIKDDVAGDPNLIISMPDKLSTRKTIVRKSPTGQIIIEVPASKDDPVMPGWNSSDKKGFWTQLVKVDANPRSSDNVAGDYDKVLRCLETVESQPAGWTVAKDVGDWMRKAPAAVKTVLQALGHAKPEAECVMGGAELQPWKLVTIPFAPEYPGDRQWNLDSPQLAVLPAPPNDDEESQHPHWDMILDHVGSSLTKRLRQEAWAQEAGIITGQQYLQAWYANVLRHPFSPLPYLFLYGPENSGKSIFHEAFSLLVTTGVVKADQALTSQFNSELEGCILAVVEEKNVATTKGAHEKIKDAVTADVISIRRMRTDVYQVRNTTHWVQCSNNIEACPIFNGDSRITVIHVPEINREIPKERLKKALMDEAPFFLRTLLNMTLPPPRSRLRLPLVNTDEKIAIIAGNQTVTEAFIEEMCEVRKGNEMLYADFYDALQQYPGGAEISRQKLSRELCVMRGITVRAGAQNKRYIIGLSLKPQKEKK